MKDRLCIRTSMPGHPGKVLDDSKVSEAPMSTALRDGHTGVVVEHRRLDGARLARVMHPPRQRIAPHGHDWPVLTLYRIGGYREVGEAGEIEFDGPSVVFQPAGAAHADEIGAMGLETLSVMFDPAWLGADARKLLPRRTWWGPGGTAAAASRQLAALWLNPDASERELGAATSRFLLGLFTATSPPRRPA